LTRRCGSLNSLYELIADLDRGFPPSTAESETEWWQFTVKVWLKDGVKEAMRRGYLDYGGESLSKLFSMPSLAVRGLRRRMLDADVLIGMLDGMQFKRHLQGDPDPSFFRALGGLLA
jgi:hypothetical protein